VWGEFEDKLERGMVVGMVIRVGLPRRLADTEQDPRRR
jgi:hypothetical protein